MANLASMINVLTGVEAFPNPVALPAGTSLGGAAPITAGTYLVNCTAATLTVSPEAHDGRMVLLNRAAGIAVTLPNATGSGSLYSFFVGTTVTSNTTTITRGQTADVMYGLCLQCKASTALTPILSGGGSENTITMDGSTMGGIVGDWIELLDVAANQWFLRMVIASSGTLASPLSHT